ncbi:MAG: hypothetical protein HXS48_09175 [Theionarchaea archaeon]|nr:hypothetical protein [Theionarchaea archaeon]
MKKSSRNLLIISVVGAALVCSVVVIFSQTQWITSVSEEVPSEYTPIVPEKLPPLTSQEEAIALADEFLRNTLGDEFFNDHFRVTGIEKIVERSSLSFVVYEYTYNEYTVKMSVAVDVGVVPKDASRIVVYLSTVILEPQGILISEEQAKIIAKEYGLEPPYMMILSCEVEFKRICWRIGKADEENIKFGDLAGLLVDAENGTVIDSWIKIFGP